MTLNQAMAALAERERELARRDDELARKGLQIEELGRAVRSANATIAKLQHQLDQYIRRLYGPRSEKYDPNQLFLDPILLQSGNAPAPTPPPADPPPPEKPVRSGPARHHTPHGRLPIPEHLERVEILLDVLADEKICPETGLPMELIGYEVSEKLEFRPGRLFVNVYKRPKYASPDRTQDWKVGIACAPMPDHPIERCKADVGLISHIIVSKFCDHLPLYRQDDIFQRELVSIPRNTQDGWVLQTAEAIRLLGDELKNVVLEGDVVFTDDSPIPLLEPGRGSVRQARLWVYVRGGPAPPLTAYDFTLDRCRTRPIEYLGRYQGYVHADAYSGFDELFRKPGIIEVGCWVHARRKYDEATSSRPMEATDMLARIRRLYQVEKQCRGMTPEQRYAYRLQHSPAVLHDIFEQIERLQPTLLPSEPLCVAVNYSLNQREALHRFLDDGRLEVDNNTAENAVRPLALGRKNWLFAGSPRGGEATALFLGLMQSCRVCKVNPWEYLNDVLRRIMSHPANRLRELLPDQWRPLPKDTNGLIIR